jgi:hypothetical protein
MITKAENEMEILLDETSEGRRRTEGEGRKKEKT